MHHIILICWIALQVLSIVLCSLLLHSSIHRGWKSFFYFQCHFLLHCFLPCAMHDIEREMVLRKGKIRYPIFLIDLHSYCIYSVLYFDVLGPEPAFGQPGLGGSSGGYTSHGYTSHALLRSCGAQLRGLVSHWTGSSGRTCSWWLVPGGYTLITGSLRV